MAPSPTWVSGVAEAVGPVDAVAGLGPGTWRCQAGGRAVVVKTADGVGDEAAGLRALAGVASGPPVPDVIHAAEDVLVTAWVDRGDRTPAGEEGLGRGLARLHDHPWPVWGGGSSWIGRCRVDPAESAGPVELYRRRIGALAERCGLQADVGPVLDRLADLLPAGGPALLHGDLWWGNVLWALDGRAWLIDPSAHGGHPEEDLAMLALFGPVPDRLLGAYREIRPLEPGFADRVQLFQLVPLLVHAVLFGGSYRSGAITAAHRYH